MSRDLSATNQTAIAAAHVRPLLFVKLEFDGGTQYVHNGVGSYVWGSQTWLGVGALGQIGELEEGLDLSPFGVRMTLNALDSSLLSVAVTEEVFNRRATIYIGLLDENGVLVDTPQERWSGFMDSLSVQLGGDDALALQCENDFRFFDQANGSQFTDEDQQLRYSGDVFFEFLPQLVDTKGPVWGVGGAPATVGVKGGRMHGGAPSENSEWQQRGRGGGYRP